MYDRNSPLFAFGYGLSYTNFEYGDLSTDRVILKTGETVQITLNVRNTGSMDGDEVVQLYVSYPDSKVERPAKALKGFRRIHIPAGGSIAVSIPLKAEDLAYWDTAQHAFVVEKGNIRLMVGAASDDIRVNGTIEVR
jgi:beta-glucosidase